MKDLLKLFKQQVPVENFDSSRSTRVAGHDPLLVVRRSKKPETINYRTFKPERDGLFCPRSRAGEGLRVPVRQVQAPEASRRGLREVRRRGTSPRCAASAWATSSSRADRAYLVPEIAPLAHRPHARHDAARNRARAVLRGLRGRGSGMTSLQRGQLLTDEMYLESIEEHGDEFDARMGAEAVHELLKSMDLPAEVVKVARTWRTPTPRPRSSGCPSA